MYSRNQLFKLFVCFLALALKSSLIFSSVIPEQSRLGDQNLDNITDLNDLLSNDDKPINSSDSIDDAPTDPRDGGSTAAKRSSVDGLSSNAFAESNLVNHSSASPISPSSTSDRSINKSPLISSNLTVGHTIRLGNETRSSLNLQISATKDSLSVNQTYTVSLADSKLNSSGFLEDHKQLIQNLVKEESQVEDQNKLKNEINLAGLGEKPSTNSILNEELLNEFKVSAGNENSMHKSDQKKLDDTFDGAEHAGQESHSKHFTFEMDDPYSLRISESMDCIFVRSEDGAYNFYSNKNQTEVCALYIIADSNQLVEFEFQEFNVSCGEWNPRYPKNNQSLVSIVDGWELNGQFFPSNQDHKLKKSERYKELCLNRTDDLVSQKFRLSQNVGLIQFRILNPFEGFKVRVKFIDNPKRELLFGLSNPTGVFWPIEKPSPKLCHFSFITNFWRTFSELGSSPS